ncbi:MAG: hypothetical protein IJV69_00325, partial [Kiritimatiellae bacterium]|nr:hypothetical protein [Kiritimatiellia bacterium]
CLLVGRFEGPFLGVKYYFDLNEGLVHLARGPRRGRVRPSFTLREALVGPLKSPQMDFTAPLKNFISGFAKILFLTILRKFVILKGG